jgi:Ca-activated chloride channel homolog
MQTRSLVAAALLTSTFAATPAATPVTIHGRVTDELNGRPLDGATVSAPSAGLRAGSKTNAGGAYSLTIDAASATDSITFTVTRQSYMPKTVRIGLARRNNITLNFSLHPVTSMEMIVYPPQVEFSGKGVKGGVARGVGYGSLRRPNVIVPRERGNTEGYALIDDNPFYLARQTPLSTFSVDVDRASYSNVRRFLREGKQPPKDAVRIEELINYFPYAYPEPTGSNPVSIVTNVGAAPWNRAHRLVMVGLKAKSIPTASLPSNNLVFLIDVSGSMQPPNKLPLVKAAFELLVNQLRAQDRVAIVVYAGSSGLVLPSTTGANKSAIMDAITRLEAGGSTAGGAGLRLAYKVARENFDKRGNNRVILATDGDFNVGVSSDAEMTRLIEEERESGVFLSVLGFGTGNLKDSKMEQMADRGNGNFAYIDSELEAKKVFVSEFGATLRTVAKDVKLQVEFNPTRVAAYRLIGYENRRLNDQDFADDTKDAGDMGAGHTVTALYEIIPAGASKDSLMPPGASPLRYSSGSVRESRSSGKELLYVKLRYKEPDGSKSRLMSQVVMDNTQAATGDFAFASAVAEFGMLLRQSKFRGSASFESVSATARETIGADSGGYRSEFVKLVEQASALGAVAQK